ncbi:hypothetical protein WA158_005090 [Blastocystis sp. Blastoise]
MNRITSKSLDEIEDDLLKEIEETDIHLNYLSGRDKEEKSINSYHSCSNSEDLLLKTNISSKEDENNEYIEEESNEYIIQLKNIHKTHLIGIEGICSLRGIDLLVKRGEWVIIVGKSGSGKSTLLNIIGTIDLPSRGEYICDHILINSKTTDSLLSLLRLNTIGFVFQAFNLLPSLTAFQNIELPMILSGKLNKQERKNRVIYLLKKVGMYKRKDNYPSQMSGGEQQRVTIARALANNPSLLLLDEPTGDLDTTNTYRIIRLLYSIHNEGTTLLMVTHDMNIPSIGTRILYINDGKILQEQYNGIDKRLQALDLLQTNTLDIGKLSQETNISSLTVDPRLSSIYNPLSSSLSLSIDTIHIDIDHSNNNIHQNNLQHSLYSSSTNYLICNTIYRNSKDYEAVNHLSSIQNKFFHYYSIQ